MKKVNFYLKRPARVKTKTQKRTSFGIFKRTTNADNSTLDEVIEHPDLKAINNRFLNDEIEYNQAEINAKNIILNLKAASGVATQKLIFNSYNEHTLVNFLNSYCARRPYLKDKDGAKNKFMRAVRALGNVSLETATLEELVTVISGLNCNDNKKREISIKLNSILKFIGRNLIIPAPKKPINEVLYLTPNEIQLVCRNINDPLMVAAIMLSFWTGIRIGELYGLKHSSRKNGYLLIDTQEDRNGNKRAPKNDKKRRAFLPEEALPYFEEWINGKDNTEFTRNSMSKVFSKVCKTTFKSKTKHCSWHDIRHSNAIHLVSSGVPISLVAQSLGNSIAVCEEYYSGYILTDEGVESIKRILAKS